MNDKFYFYVCDSEYCTGRYNGFKGGEPDNNITEFTTPEGVDIKFCKESDGNVCVIVVNGKDVDSKRIVGKCYHSNDDKQILSVRIADYFEALAKIAERTFDEYALGSWNPKYVTVITHWGGSPVEDREAKIADAAVEISDDRFKTWKPVSSSSIRRSAFPAGCNPFCVETEVAANLPNVEDCQELERTLPSSGEIKWDDVENGTVTDKQLKEYYDRLMLRLNH